MLELSLLLKDFTKHRYEPEWMDSDQPMARLSSGGLESLPRLFHAEPKG